MNLLRVLNGFLQKEIKVKKLIVGVVEQILIVIYWWYRRLGDLNIEYEMNQFILEK